MKNVIVRCDSSQIIGNGHVMRSLTLAEKLCRYGYLVSFICRQHRGNLITFIEQKGYKVHRLPVDDSCSVNNFINDSRSLSYFHWLASTQEQDALACVPIIERYQPEWVIVDHYAIDYCWQRRIKKYCGNLMVIDDLADRKHECDLLLDQTVGRKTNSYKSLVPEHCKLLLGANYIMLRPEFIHWQNYSLDRRKKKSIKSILITMGGVDQNNITGKIINILECHSLQEEPIELVVILGRNAPHIDKIKRQVEKSSLDIILHIDATNMAEIMANVDIAIGAAGSTTWERCYLGVPSLLITLAKNQEYIAEKVAISGAAINLGSSLDPSAVINKLIYIKNNLREMNQKALSMLDGKGVSRVVEHML